MAQAAAIIALSERLRKQSRRARNRETVVDLRLATYYLRALAVLKIAEEAEVATDPERKQQLDQEAAQLRIQAR
jgi:cytidylate kinase